MIGRILLVAACLSGIAAHAAKLGWERTWTVQQVLCGACTTSDRTAFQKYIGTKIVFDPDRFINPADESCPSGVVYSDIYRRNTAYAYATMPGLPQIPRKHVIAGIVGCKLPHGPPNTVARVAFDKSTGYYLFEGGAIFVLR